MLNTRHIVRFAMLIMIQVVFTQFIGLTTPIMRISFTFLAMSWVGYFYGWKTGMLLAGAADLLGMMLFPKGPYFVGFTISAMVSGALYGLLFKFETKITKRVLLITILDNLIVNLLMNTLWLHLLYGKAMSVLLVPRIFKLGLSIPIMYFSTLSLVYFMKKHKKRFM